MTYNIPLAIPQIDLEEEKTVLEVLKSGWLTHGPFNEKFEEKFASYIGVEEAIAMNSCTSALEIALKANDITGDVIIPSFTFVATANSVINSGANPIFCDVDFDTRNMTLELIKEVITDNTQAIMVVHFAGQPCNMEEISVFCEDNNLLLIEDSAETIGAKYGNKQAGSYGIGCYSFFPTKNMTTGEGGMLTCNDKKMAEKIRALIGHGIVKSSFQREKSEKPWFRSASIAGHNFRMSNLLAAIGFHQMDKLDDMNNHRKKIASIYNELLKDNPYCIQVPTLNPKAEHVYQMYTITVDPNIRDTLVIQLRQKGIFASVHFDPPVHKQEFYKDFPLKRPLTNTEKLSDSIISLPIYQTMPEEYATIVIENIFEILKQGV